MKHKLTISQLCCIPPQLQRNSVINNAFAIVQFRRKKSKLKVFNEISWACANSFVSSKSNCLLNRLQVITTNCFLLITIHIPENFHLYETRMVRFSLVEIIVFYLNRCPFDCKQQQVETGQAVCLIFWAPSSKQFL